MLSFTVTFLAILDALVVVHINLTGFPANNGTFDTGMVQLT